MFAPPSWDKIADRRDEFSDNDILPLNDPPFELKEVTVKPGDVFKHHGITYAFPSRCCKINGGIFDSDHPIHTGSMVYNLPVVESDDSVTFRMVLIPDTDAIKMRTTNYKVTDAVGQTLHYFEGSLGVI